MQYGLEQVHADLTEVLADVVRVLDENDLPYSMICGSLLVQCGIMGLSHGMTMWIWCCRVKATIVLMNYTQRSAG